MNEAYSSGSVIDCGGASALMDALTDLVVRAGIAILAVDRRTMKIDGKADGSPVTEADLAADRIIADGLACLVPHIPSLSEERVDLAGSAFHRGSFFLIDPLDGTKEYAAGRAEFTVNLALVTNGTPLLGIIGAPALGLIWRGLVGRGAQRLMISGSATGVAEPIRTRRIPPAARRGPRPSAVRMAMPEPRLSSTAGRALSGRRSARRSSSAAWRKAKSISIPDLRPTSEWDIAAGHAVVTAAGGKITDAEGADIHFGTGRKDFIVPEFIAWGDPAAAP